MGGRGDATGWVRVKGWRTLYEMKKREGLKKEKGRKNKRRKGLREGYIKEMKEEMSHITTD